MSRWQNWPDAIFAASRVDNGRRRRILEEAQRGAARADEWLNGQRFDALQYSGPGTDLGDRLADAMNGRRRFDGEERHHLHANIRPRKSSPRRMRGGSAGHVVSSKPAVVSGEA